MNRGCDRMIVLGRLCGDALFLFAERSMPVPYIGDPDIKISDPHPSPTQRVLLDCRQPPHYDSLPAGAPGKNIGPAPRPDPTCFTRLSTSTMSDSLGPGPARQKKCRTATAARPHVFYSTADNCHTTTVCPRRLAAENDPWRFRQQSSRVISIQFWYLTSWLPRFL